MANINKIQLPNGTQYDIEDAIAREKVFIITLTNSEDEQTGEMIWSANKTYVQISAACTAGKVCIASLTIPEYATILVDLKQITSEKAKFVSEEVEVFIYSNGTVTVTGYPYLFHVDCPVVYNPSTGVRTVTLNTSFSDIVEAYNRGRELCWGDGSLLYFTNGEDYFLFINSANGIVISNNESITTVQYFPIAIKFDYDSTNNSYSVSSGLGNGFTPSEIEVGFYYGVRGITLTFDYTNYYPVSFKHSGSNYYLSFVDPQTGATKILTAVGDVNKWTLTEVSGGEQSDWEEDDTTDMAYVLNRPAIRAGTGENSVIIGGTESDAATYTLYLTGAAGNTFTYTTEDTLPSAGNIKNYGFLKIVSDNAFVYVKDIDTTNHTITVNRTLTGTITNLETILYFKYRISDGVNSVSEGRYSIADGSSAHSEGLACFAQNQGTHAEGNYTRASGLYSHTEGNKTEALGTAAHAEGHNTIASGMRAHTEGYYTISQRRSQHVFGEYNIADTGGSATSQKGNYIEIVGNGAAEASRSNARTLDWSGNETLAGKLTVGAGPVNNMDVATKQYVDQNAGDCDPSDATPLADGVASAGSSNYYARGDHVHPKITQTISMSNNIITLTGSDGTTSSVTLPVYNGSVSTGGSSS